MCIWYCTSISPFLMRYPAPESMASFAMDWSYMTGVGYWPLCHMGRSSAHQGSSWEGSVRIPRLFCYRNGSRAQLADLSSVCDLLLCFAPFILAKEALLVFPSVWWKNYGGSRTRGNCLSSSENNPTLADKHQHVSHKDKPIYNRYHQR